MDINPTKITEMMTLLDDHEEHMPSGTRLALCNKLLECKEEQNIEINLQNKIISLEKKNEKLQKFMVDAVVILRNIKNRRIQSIKSNS